MPKSENDLQKQRDEIVKLRQQVADEEAKRNSAQVDVSRDIESAQLEAEAARLRGDLERAKANSKAAIIKQGAAAPLEAAREAMRAAAVEDGVLAAEERAQAEVKKAASSDAPADDAAKGK